MGARAGVTAGRDVTESPESQQREERSARRDGQTDGRLGLKRALLLFIYLCAAVTAGAARGCSPRGVW